MNALSGTLFLLFGLFLLVYRERISRRAVEDWSRTFPRVRIRKWIYDAFATLGGVGFVTAGILMLLGVIGPR